MDRQTRNGQTFMSCFSHVIFRETTKSDAKACSEVVLFQFQSQFQCCNACAHRHTHAREQREIAKVFIGLCWVHFPFGFVCGRFAGVLAGRSLTVSFFEVADLATVSFVMKRSGPVRVEHFSPRETGRSSAMASSKGPSTGSKGRNRKKTEVPPPSPEKEMSVTYSESEPESDGDSSPSLVLLSETWRPACIRNFRQWGKTVCTMPKYRRSRLCFDELLELGRGNAECQKYLKWIHASYATAQTLECEERNGARVLVSQPRNQATDLALFLEAASYSEELEALEGGRDGGYKREFKN